MDCSSLEFNYLRSSCNCKSPHYLIDKGRTVVVSVLLFYFDYSRDMEHLRMRNINNNIEVKLMSLLTSFTTIFCKVASSIL